MNVSSSQPFTDSGMLPPNELKNASATVDCTCVSSKPVSGNVSPIPWWSPASYQIQGSSDFFAPGSCSQSCACDVLRTETQPTGEGISERYRSGLQCPQ